MGGVAEANGRRAEVRMRRDMGSSLVAGNASLAQGCVADGPFGGMCQGPGSWKTSWQRANTLTVKHIRSGNCDCFLLSCSPSIRHV
jgi:hypothetical protein